MFLKRLKRVAETIGLACFVLLAVYGLLSIMKGEPAWADWRSDGSAPVPAQAPQTAPMLASSSWGSATVPLVMNYQGELKDVEGNPLSGYYTMTFRIYDDVIAPLSVTLWSETHVSVTVRAGNFSVLLGNNKSISETLFNDHDRFIGVQVSGYDEMVPRQRFASVPYAVHANHATTATAAIDADLLNGVPATVLAPPGSVMAYAGSVPPEGWLVCDGSDIDRVQYPALFAAITTTHGNGNGATTFNIPDYRGYFLRGVDAGTGRDPDALSRTAIITGANIGDVVGSVQENATSRPNTPFTTTTTGNHNHLAPTANYSGSSYEVPKDKSGYDYGDAAPTSYSGNHSHAITSGGDNETRPINAYVIWIIKY
ncbi:MAG: tail fiber protein [Chloroflexi bacterium]|nr:tail fiber protein [Chloroflexota bacterium]